MTRIHLIPNLLIVAALCLGIAACDDTNYSDTEDATPCLPWKICAVAQGSIEFSRALASSLEPRSSPRSRWMVSSITLLPARRKYPSSASHWSRNPSV